MTACTYCHRELTPRSEGGPLAHTRDHIIPKSKGGIKVVPACYSCNNRKGDMMPEQWIAFMASNPRWWERPSPAKMSNRPRLDMPAEENAARMTAYLHRNRIRPPPLEKTREFLRNAALRPASPKSMSAGENARRIRAYFEANPQLRPLRQDEPIPIEYDDPIKQAAFEATYSTRRFLLRVPV